MKLERILERGLPLRSETARREDGDRPRGELRSSLSALALFSKSDRRFRTAEFDRGCSVMAVEGRRRVYQRWSFALSPVYDVRCAQWGRSACRWSEGGQEESRSCDVEGQDGNEGLSIFNCGECGCVCVATIISEGVEFHVLPLLVLESFGRECCEAHTETARGRTVGC